LQRLTRELKIGPKEHSQQPQERTDAYSS
jgi:hypothetical protein